ncbi:unnamed protein product, partial [Ixodes persulcatus]
MNRSCSCTGSFNEPICFLTTTLSFVKEAMTCSSCARREKKKFLEIMALVGMASKPLHVRRLQKALQEWVNNPAMFQTPLVPSLPPGHPGGVAPGPPGAPQPPGGVAGPPVHGLGPLSRPPVSMAQLRPSPPVGPSSSPSPGLGPPKDAPSRMHPPPVSA